MLKEFCDMCSFLSDIPCALIGKHSWINLTQETSEQAVRYKGFIPRKFLDKIPLEICKDDSSEEFPNHMGYLEIRNIPDLEIDDDDLQEKPVKAVIYCLLKSGTGIFKTLDQSVSDSRMFNLQTSLTFWIDLDFCRDLEADEFLGKKLPIKSVEVSPGDIACGDMWIEQRKARSKLKNPYRTPLTTKISYAWSVFINIVWLALAAYLYKFMATNAEVILLSVLILLYVQVRFSQVGAFEIFLNGQRQFKHLLKLFGDPILQDEGMLHEIEKEDDELRKTTISKYINLAFLSCLSFVALWKIVNVIFELF